MARFRRNQLTKKNTLAQSIERYFDKFIFAYKCIESEKISLKNVSYSLTYSEQNAVKCGLF